MSTTTTASASPLAAADSMMTIASTEAGAAMFILPPAAMINFQFKLCKGNPANLDKAGAAWRDVAQQLQQLGMDLQQAVARIPQDAWSADDRTAYEQKIQEFCAQLQIMYTFCLAVGVALTVHAYALFAYAVFAVGMGTFLAGLAAVALAAAASVVGAPVYAECQAIAATCLTITEGATAILAGASTGVGAIFQGGALMTAVAETAKGNKAALNDFKQAEATGSAAAGANLLQNAANAGLAYVNRYDEYKNPLNPKEKGPAGKPLKSIDLDADRDMNHTWNVGGTATGNIGGTTVTGGGHVKVGDQGLQGVEGEYKATRSGFTAGEKVGWERNAQGEDIVYGNETLGYEGQKSGVGVTETGETKYNVDQRRFDSGKIDIGETYKGGQLGKETVEKKPDEKQ